MISSCASERLVAHFVPCPSASSRRSASARAEARASFRIDTIEGLTAEPATSPPKLRSRAALSIRGPVCSARRFISAFPGEQSLDFVEKVKSLARRQFVRPDRGETLAERVGLRRGRGSGGCGKERQILEETALPLAAIALLEDLKHLRGPRGDAGRKSGEFRDLDTIGTVGYSRD